MADDITPEAFDPTALTDTELSAEFARVAERGQALAAIATHTEDEAAEFSTLADQLPVFQAETAARIERATAAQAQRDAFSSVSVPSIPTVTPLTPVAAPESAPQAAPAPQVPFYWRCRVVHPHIIL